MAIFSVVSIGFITVLVSVFQAQTKQSAAAEVNGQSQFLLQTIQRYIQNASLVDMAADVSSSSLRLRMSDASKDPTTISVSGGTIFVTEGAGAAVPLTSSRVSATALTFVKRENPGGRDIVNISFTLSYNTNNPVYAFVQTLQTSVARVSASTFDSNLIPASPGAYTIGNAAFVWSAINNLIFFSGSNVGISTAAPSDPLEVNGRLRTSGDVYVNSNVSGLILRSPNNSTCARVTITNAGVVTSTVLGACP